MLGSRWEIFSSGRACLEKLFSGCGQDGLDSRESKGRDLSDTGDTGERQGGQNKDGTVAVEIKELELGKPDSVTHCV